jgi:hypothetical protein
MNCYICGTPTTNISWNKGARALCKACDETTPVKVSFSEFVRVYFKDDPSVPYSTRREFFSDYLSSTYTLEQYIAETSSPA